MRISKSTIRGFTTDEFEGDGSAMKAASLVKPVLGHLAMSLVEDLDERVTGDITVRHILSHTTGLPNWHAPGEPLAPLRPPGTRWGYSGEGFVLLQRHLEERSGRSIDQVATELVFGPLGMNDSWFGSPELEFHGSRPLMTTGADYARFVGHVLAIDDERWEPQWRIDDELAWGVGWGLELGPPVCGWQWGADHDASNFVIGCPSTGDGVVVLTDAVDARSFYRDVVTRVLPGDHPSLRLDQNTTWIELFA